MPKSAKPKPAARSTKRDPETEATAFRMPQALLGMLPRTDLPPEVEKLRLRCLEIGRAGGDITDAYFAYQQARKEAGC